MLKRLIGMIILVLATAFSVVLTSTGLGLDALLPHPAEVNPVETTLPALPTAVVPVGPTIEVVTATLEPTVEVLPTQAATAVPSATPAPTATPVPTATLPAPTPTAVPFKVQQMTPIFMSNFAHADSGCNWQGVAGQIFDAQDSPILNYIVKITGTYNSTPVDLYGVTGMTSALVYGPGGFEIVLGNAPAANQDTLSIQVFDQAGNALTEPLKFSTSKECSQNLVLINFQQK